MKELFCQLSVYKGVLQLAQTFRSVILFPFYKFVGLSVFELKPFLNQVVELYDVLFFLKAFKFHNK